MKFSEFKQVVKRHNELVLALRQMYKREWSEEIRKCNAYIDDFYMENNLYVLCADEDFLRERLKQFMSSEENQQLFTEVAFTRFQKDNGPVFTITAKKYNKGYKGDYPVSFSIGKIFDGDNGPMSCVDLASVLDFEGAERFGVLSEIPGIEDFLWQVAEEDFNRRIEKQISLLTKTRKKIEAKKAKVQQPDFVENEVAKLEAKDKKAVQQIEALKARLG